MRTTGKNLLPRIEGSAAMFAPYVRPHRGCPEEGARTRSRHRQAKAALAAGSHGAVGRSELLSPAALIIHDSSRPSCFAQTLTPLSVADNNQIADFDHSACASYKAGYLGTQKPARDIESTIARAGLGEQCHAGTCESERAGMPILPDFAGSTVWLGWSVTRLANPLVRDQTATLICSAPVSCGANWVR